MRWVLWSLQPTALREFPDIETGNSYEPGKNLWDETWSGNSSESKEFAEQSRGE